MSRLFKPKKFWKIGEHKRVLNDSHILAVKNILKKTPTKQNFHKLKLYINSLSDEEVEKLIFNIQCEKSVLENFVSGVFVMSVFFVTPILFTCLS